MLTSILKAHWLRLLRDKVALFLVFVLPIIFFSVFAIIFGGAGSSSSKPADLKIAVWDQDQSEASRKMMDALKDVSGLKLVPVKDNQSTEEPQSDGVTPVDQLRKAAARLVQQNAIDAAVILPVGFQDSLGAFDGNAPAVDLIYDSANPMAEGMISGVLQGTVFTAMPDTLLNRGLEQFRTFGGPFNAQQEFAAKQFSQLLSGDADKPEATESASSDETTKSATSAGMNSGLININTMSARGLIAPRKKASGSGSMIAYYAAGVAVMFLMFSMAGSASALLEDQENGTLDRLISGQMTISTLMLAHWTYFVLLGIVQLLVMFSFAAIVFKVDLSTGPVLFGVVAMSIVTSMASAGFVMFLATLCRSRKQLESISTTVILVMSAFGGSMVPRHILPEFVRETSKLTFNGWALEGYLKVLWYYDPAVPILQTLTWHLVVIVLMAFGFLSLAMWRAKRWSFA